MSVISQLPNYLQVSVPFQLQPYGWFGQNQMVTDPAVIAAINASSKAANCASVANPDYVRSSGVVASPGTAEAITANGQTITVVEQGSVLLTTALGAGVTGLILQKGAVDRQELTLLNNSSQTMTFAAAGTSNVQGGTGTAMLTDTAKKFIWEVGTALWWPC